MNWPKRAWLLVSGARSVYKKFHITRMPAGAEEGLSGAVSPFLALGCVESKAVAQGMGLR